MLKKFTHQMRKQIMALLVMLSLVATAFPAVPVYADTVEETAAIESLAEEENLDAEEQPEAGAYVEAETEAAAVVVETEAAVEADTEVETEAATEVDTEAETEAASEAGAEADTGAAEPVTELTLENDQVETVTVAPAAAVTEDGNSSFAMESAEVSVRAGESITVYLQGNVTESISSVSASDTKIASASTNSGRRSITVKGLKIGTTAVTVTGSLGNVCTINVTVESPADPLYLETTSLVMTAGDDDWFDVYTDGEAVESVISSNENVADIDYYSSYDEVNITALTPGKTTITFTGEYGTVCKMALTVNSFLQTTSVTVNAEKVRYVRFKPEEVDNYYSVASADTSIAKASIFAPAIYDYEDAVRIEAVKPGSTVINVKGPNGSTCPIKVTVTKPSIKLSASAVTVTSSKQCTITASESAIYKVTSSNTNVLTVKKVNDTKLQITPVRLGKAVVTVENRYGIKAKVTVTIDGKYFKALLTSKTTVGKLYYFGRKITGKSVPGALVSAKIGNNVYRATVNSNGNYSLTIPVCKIGTTITVYYKYQKQAVTKAVKVLKCDSEVWLPNYTYRNTTKVLVKATNVHQGDKIKLIVGTKTYVKTITSTAKNYSSYVTINKPVKYGIKMKVLLLNKYNQTLSYENDYVYHSNVVHVGDTKAKVRWLTGWNDPDTINYYSTGEQWCYDWDYDEYGFHDAYLYFDVNGRVRDWWISD